VISSWYVPHVAAESREMGQTRYMPKQTMKILTYSYAYLSEKFHSSGIFKIYLCSKKITPIRNA
jgi:hypothetical protein